MKITQNNVSQTSEKVNPSNAQTAFEKLKRDFEDAYNSGSDYSAELLELATAVAKSVLNKVIDPQRKTAGQLPKVSDSGINKALDEFKRGIYCDRKNLDSLAYWANLPYTIEYDKDGERHTVYHEDATDAIDTLIDYTISDGMDFVQVAITALLEQAHEHAASGEQWLDSVYTVQRLSKRVYIQEPTSAAVKMVDTTPMQEIYRTVRRYIAASRQVNTDPHNPYTYVAIDALEPEQLEQIFVRSGKYADIGGTDCNGLYTGDYESLKAYTDAKTMLDKLNLTARELQILKLRMQGYSTRAIAEHISISHGSLDRSIVNIRRKAVENDLHI